MQLTPEEQKKQERYRDARFTKQYDQIWQTVGKCVFCDLRDKYIFFEENGVVMHVSLYAYIDGHFMITPRRHIRSPKELTQTEWDTVRKFFYIAKKLIRDVHGVKGMQLVQKDGSEAQGTVDQHLHFHCIPFDAPDLCTWNYRRLKYTPLENVALYRDAGKKIVSLDGKFNKKYRNPTTLRIMCAAVILNEKNEILLEERKPEYKLKPDYRTLPGGGVDDFSVPLETELAREIREETGLDINTAKVELQLIDSRLASSTIAHYEEHLDMSRDVVTPFLWNTYLIRGITSDAALTAGDDCESLAWVDLHKAMKLDRVSQETREILAKVQT
jgi:diadenosine tetraphosphate (Ap4A) HIT family hydrolase/8-oxo-dGTP pyrophosphatase MutT (NUDIX family)